VKIISRSEWTSGKTGSNGTYRDVLGMVAHWPADGYKTHSGDRAHVKAMLQSYRRYHVGTRGWQDIGYNFAIDMAGNVWEGRGMRNVGAHCASAANPGANTRYVGVIFIVGSQQDLTPKAVAAFYDLQKEVLKAFPGATQVLGHRQVRGASTTCPGNRVLAALSGQKPAPSKTAPSKSGGKKGQMVGPEYKFPMPSDHYFGPKEQGPKSRSGYYPKKFSGKTDRQWLIEFGKQLARRGWSVGKGKTWLKKYGNNGYYGPEYNALIKKFQSNMGLRANGALGPDTWNAAFNQPIK